GTGFTEKSLREILKKLRPLEQSSSPFAANSPRERGIHWVRPTLSADVSFHNWTDDGRLRIPVFHGLREDKPVQEIQREHPKKSSAPWLVSHPDKIIYAKEKISKQEIANYYKRVASSMVPLMQNRPLALFRSPEGTHRSSFFQKHLPNPLPEGLEGVEIQEKSGNKTYVNVLNSKGLESLIQMGSFEIHCWNSHKDHLDFPDQIVMDFDPGPGITWSQVVTAAFDLKKILEKLSLKSFVKLSGGKGLHVHIPIRPIYHWTQIKNFSEVLAKEMENRQPHLYISKMSKAAREKKIFIDFFRNHRGSTAVAPYSLRSRAMSSAALPVEWSQLKEIKSSDEFTLTKTFSFLRQRKKDPWRNFSKIQQKIPLLDRLNK
ncbi:MAG TPA: non-homologous end-joining DNA ligase, partial [Bdellovibrio sp.]|nr:non-homologous end-joining DNA ligase [Bdellovibrio sp.]